MAKLEVLQYPDDRLRLKAEPVTDFGPQTQQVIQDMFDTLYGSENCAGYAAIQMNIQQQIIVIDLSLEKNQPLLLINPEIIATEGETYEPEGCMSVPEVFASVKRAKWVHVKAQDKDGNEFEIKDDTFLSKCIQHEIDHLNGILFIDYLSPLKRQRLEKKLKKRGIKINV